MRRAKLHPDEVTRIVLMASMTPVDMEVTPDTELAARKSDGLLDVGWHYLITRDGHCHVGVPSDERGNRLPRYARTSIVIKVVGGWSDEHMATKNFTHNQMWAVGQLVRNLRKKYPLAQPTLYRELFKGVNPVFGHEDY